MIREKNFGELGEVLSAYLDGELSPDEMEQVENLMREDESARRMLSELRQTVQAVSGLPRRPAPESVREEVQLRLERNELLEELPAGPIRRSRPRVRWGAILSMAAVLGVVVIAGMWTLTDRGRELPMADDVTLAQRSGETSPFAERDAAVESRRETATDSREVVAMARRSAPRESDEPDAAPLRAMRRVERDTARTRGRVVQRGRVPAEVATAARPPEVADYVGARDAVEATRPDPGAMRLQLSVSSESERVALVSKLEGQYAPYQTAQVSYPNASAPSEQVAQLALQLPLAQVDELLSAVDEKNGVSEMALTAGPLTVRGKYRVREVLALAQSTMDNGMMEEATMLSASEEADSPVKDERMPGSDHWRDLIRSLGIDPDTLALLLRPTNGEAEAASVAVARPDDAAVDAVALAPDTKADKTPEQSLVARRLQAAEQAEPQPESPAAVEPTAATMATATVNVIIEISVSDPSTQLNGSKPAYPTRARRINPGDPDRKRPTAQ